MKKNLLNKQLTKAITIAISASMALQPVTAFASEDQPVPSTSENTDNETGIPAVKKEQESVNELVNGNSGDSGVVGAANDVAELVSDIQNDFIATENSDDTQSATVVTNNALVNEYNNSFAEIAQDAKDLGTEVSEAQTHVNESLNESINDAATKQGERNDAVDTVKDTDSATDAANEAANAFDEVSDKIDDANKMIAEAKTEKQAKEAYAEAEKAVSEANEKFEEAKSDYESKKEAYEKALNDAKKAQEAYETAVNTAADEAYEAKRALEEANSKAAELKDKLGEANTRLAAAKKLAEEAGDLDFVAKEKLAKELGEKAAKADQHVKELEKDSEDGDNAKKKIDDAEQAAKDFADKNKDIIKAGKAAEEVVTEAETKVSNLKNAIEAKGKAEEAIGKAEQAVIDEQNLVALYESRLVIDNVKESIHTDHNKKIALQLYEEYLRRNNPDAEVSVEFTSREDTLSVKMVGFAKFENDHFFEVKVKTVQPSGEVTETLKYIDFDTDYHGSRSKKLSDIYIYEKVSEHDYGDKKTVMSYLEYKEYYNNKLNEAGTTLEQLTGACDQLKRDNAKTIADGTAAEAEIEEAKETAKDHADKLRNTIDAGKNAAKKVAELEEAATNLKNDKKLNKTIDDGDIAKGQLEQARSDAETANLDKKAADEAAKTAKKNYDDYEKVLTDYNNLSKAVEEAEKKTEAAAKKVEQLQQKIDDLTKTVENTDLSNDEVTNELNRLNSEYEKAQLNLKNAEEKKAEVEEELKETKKELNKKVTDIRRKNRKDQDDDNYANDSQGSDSDNTSDDYYFAVTPETSKKASVIVAKDTPEVLGAQKTVSKKADKTVAKVTTATVTNTDADTTEVKENDQVETTSDQNVVASAEQTETNEVKDQVVIADEQVALSDSVSDTTDEKRFPWLVVAILGVLGITTEEVVRRKSKKAKASKENK